MRVAKADPVSTIDTAFTNWVGSSGGTRPPPLLLVRGKLAPVFDEAKTLAALVSAGRPLGKIDTAFQQKLDAAGAFLKEADDMTPRSEFVLEADRLRQAFAASDRRTANEDELSERAKRTLAEKRAYKELAILGGAFVPVSLGDGLDTAATRCGYMPKDAATRLPLTPEVDVRAIVEVVPLESDVVARASFRVRAIARELPFPTR